MSKLYAKILRVTPALANFGAGAYAAGDQLGALNTVLGIANDRGGPFELVSLAIIDKAKQKSAIDVYFFDAIPALVNADNGAFDVSDADMVAKCLGKVSIAAADYGDEANNSTATKSLLGFMGKAAAGLQDVYCVAVSRGTPTFVSASDLQLVLGVKQY